MALFTYTGLTKSAVKNRGNNLQRSSYQADREGLAIIVMATQSGTMRCARRALDHFGQVIWIRGKADLGIASWQFT